VNRATAIDEHPFATCSLDGYLRGVGVRSPDGLIVVTLTNVAEPEPATLVGLSLAKAGIPGRPVGQRQAAEAAELVRLYKRAELLVVVSHVRDAYCGRKLTAWLVGELAPEMPCIW
jgi:hypothetical protein